MIADDDFFDPIFRAIDSESTDEIVRVLDAGSDVNATLRGGTTPLISAMGSDVAIVRLLIERGADVNKANGRGETPLHHAVEFTLNQMIASGDEGEPRRIDWSLIRILLEAGADPLRCDDRGRSPIDCLDAFGFSKSEASEIMLHRRFLPMKR